MQTNHIELVRVHTSTTAGGTQDDTPNEVAGNAIGTFYLSILAEAGDALGDLEAAYTLYINASSPSGGKTNYTRQRLAEKVAAGQFGWKDLGSNHGYVKQVDIPISSGDFPPGDVYQFTVTLLTKSGIMSTVAGNAFVTI